MYYFSMEYEEWIDMINPLEVEDEMQKYSTWTLKNKSSPVKKVDAPKDYSGSDITLSRVDFKKNNARTGQNPSSDDAYKSQSIQHYFILCKKFGIPKVKYASHSRKNWFGINENVANTNRKQDRVVTKQDSSVILFLGYNKKLKKELKYMNRKKKELFNIDRRTISFKDLRDINNIKATKYDFSSDRNINIGDYYSRYSDSEWEV